MFYNRWICSPPSTGIDPARSTSHTENAVSGGFDNTDYGWSTPLIINAFTSGAVILPVSDV